MSLKDRLGSVQQIKQNTQDEQQEQQPKYYNTDIEANVDSLGALDTILSDDDLNSVFVSGAKNIYLEKKGKIFKSTTTFRDNVQLENMLKKIALSQNFFEQFGLNYYGPLKGDDITHLEAVLNEAKTTITPPFAIMFSADFWE